MGKNNKILAQNRRNCYNRPPRPVKTPIRDSNKLCVPKNNNNNFDEVSTMISKRDSKMDPKDIRCYNSTQARISCTSNS